LTIAQRAGRAILAHHRARLAVIGDREFGNARMQGKAMPQYQPIAATHLSNIERPRCPKCETRMLLSEVAPGPDGFDYRTFECQKCGQVHAISVSQDPMQSETRGWLAGELKPPT
jgi:hypothetical protein